MPRIEFTNLVLDDFSIAKKELNRVFTHILTHIHTDHLKGLHDGWNYGPIYCTEQTKRMLLHRYPSLTCLRTIEQNVPTVLKMSQTLELAVTFLDANHCVGSVMVIIQGYLGRILYTGDIRYDRRLFSTYSQLYPPQKLTSSFVGCSKHVDILYLDNTFLKKKFDFPPKLEAMERVINFVQELLNLNQHSRIFIGLDNVGKEEVLVELARHFGIYIVVEEVRYEMIKVMGLDPQLFTTNPEQGFIQVVQKKRVVQTVKETPDSIGIILSGWVNTPTYRLDGKLYCIPYSLHSSYKELHQFVNSIRPSFIYPIVHTYPDQDKLYYSQQTNLSRKELFMDDVLLKQGQGDYLSEIQELRRSYCSEPTEDYKLLINDISLQKKIEKELKPPKITDLSRDKSMLPVHLQTVERKKYKLQNTRNEVEIKRLRNQIKMKRKMQEGQTIELVNDSDQEQEISSKKISEKSVIDLDEQPQFDQEVVEVDPLYEPFGDTKTNNPIEKDKSRGSRYDTFHDTRLIQHIKDKIKNSQLSSNNRQEPSSTHISCQEIDHIKEQMPKSAVKRSRVPQSQVERRQLPSQKSKVRISQINLDKIKEIKLLTGSQVVNYLRQNPADYQFLRKEYKSESGAAGQSLQ